MTGTVSMTVVGVALLLGALGGALYFAALKASLRIVSRPLLALAALLRFGLAATLFWQAARLGAAPLLAALAGFLAARGVMLRALRGRP